MYEFIKKILDNYKHPDQVRTPQKFPNNHKKQFWSPNDRVWIYQQILRNTEFEFEVWPCPDYSASPGESYGPIRGVVSSCLGTPGAQMTT